MCLPQLIFIMMIMTQKSYKCTLYVCFERLAVILLAAILQGIFEDV